MKKTNEKNNNAKNSIFSKTNKKSQKDFKDTTSLKNTTSNNELQEILKNNPKINTVEYYDLPYRYNQTVIKILAQTPNSLFVYWDISDIDKNLMKEKFGDNFFNETKPILLVHNKTKNYSFEVEIDDFANSWYLKTPTSDCVFNIELWRKRCANISNNSDNLIHITTSNTIESPNDHVLTNTLKSAIYFKNIKTNELNKKDMHNLKSIKNTYNIIEFYSNEFTNNPSSNFKIN